MNRIDRLTAILIQLQTKRVVKAREIADRYDISLRTVYRDIRALEEAGVPIGSEAGIGYYLPKGFFLPPIMFTDEEANALLLGAKLIEQMSDESVTKEFTSALDKIKSVLRTSGKDNLELLELNIKVSQNFRRKNSGGFLAKIQKAITEQKILRIMYYSHYSDETNERYVEPIGLYFYSNAWHLIAYCRLRKDYRDFRVERIINLTQFEERFTIIDHKSLEDYIKSVTSQYDLHHIKVRFSNETAKLVHEQKYYYGFVDEEKEKQSTTMSFMSAGLEFFARWLLMFGNTVTIVSPNELRGICKELAAELFSHYK